VYFISCVSGCREKKNDYVVKWRFCVINEF
jgi:hypothetical protein